MFQIPDSGPLCRWCQGPFTNRSLQESNGRPPLYKQGKSPKPRPEGPIASCGSASLDGSYKALVQTRRKYNICRAPLHQPPNYLPKLCCYTLALQGICYLSFIHTNQFFLGKFIPAIFLFNPNYANLEANFPDVSSRNGRKHRFLPTLGSICY